MSKNTRNSELFKAQMRLLNDHEQGQLDGLKCPGCGAAEVSVWFTHPVPDIYRVWFLCEKCDFEVRAQHSGVPKNFLESRVHFPKEEYDRKLLSKMTFPRPATPDKSSSDETNGA